MLYVFPTEKKLYHLGHFNVIFSFILLYNFILLLAIKRASDSNITLIEDSLSILQEHSHVHQVQVRHLNDTPHKPEDQLYSTLNFVNFRKIPYWRDAWTGYSWNPGLRRKRDYLTMFPNGVQEFGDEIDCSKHSMNFNYLAVLLENTACFHIGYDRHTENFII